MNIRYPIYEGVYRILTQKTKINVPVDGGFKAGTSYAVTLKFTSVGITPEVSVTDWVNGTPIKDIEI